MSDVLTFQPKFALAPQVAAVAVGSLLFIVAKSMTTGGEVTIGQPLYWLIGLIPFVLLPAASKIANQIFATFGLNSRRGPIDFDFNSSFAWLFALLIFVLAHELHLASMLQIPIYEATGYRYFALTNLFLSTVYVATGYSLWIAISFYRNGSTGLKSQKLLAMTSQFGLSTLLFYILVYSIPAL